MLHVYGPLCIKVSFYLLFGVLFFITKFQLSTYHVNKKIYVNDIQQSVLPDLYAFRMSQFIHTFRQYNISVNYK